MFYNLKNSGGMDYHVVDSITRSGVSACTRRSCGSIDCHGCVESAGGNGDDLHIVEHLDIVVDIVIAVHNHTSHATLDEFVGCRVDEQNSALIGNFVIVKLCRSIINQAEDGLCGRSFGLYVRCKCARSILGETISIEFRNDLCALELTDKSTEGHA